MPLGIKISDGRHCLLDTIISEINKLSDICFMINPQAPVAQKIADQVVFRHFHGEGVEFFFKSDLTDHHQIFDAHLLETTDLSPFRFYFLVGFRSRSCSESDVVIAYSNE